MMEKPVKRPMVPPMRLIWLVSLISLSLSISSKEAVSKKIWTNWRVDLSISWPKKSDLILVLKLTPYQMFHSLRLQWHRIWNFESSFSGTACTLPPKGCKSPCLPLCRHLCFCPQPHRAMWHRCGSRCTRFCSQKSHSLHYLDSLDHAECRWTPPKK